MKLSGMIHIVDFVAVLLILPGKTSFLCEEVLKALAVQSETMSLVRSAASYGNRKLYPIKGSNDNYATDSCSNASCELRYFIDSPTDELIQLSSTGNNRSPVHNQDDSSFQRMAPPDTIKSSFIPNRNDDAYASSLESEYLEKRTPEYDENEMRLKVQELERVLLDDDSININDIMEVDDEWAGPIHSVLLHESPKESSSSESNASCISSNKEISLITSQTPKKLLFACAVAIEDGNMEEASMMINELRQRVSIQGDPSQRIAAYMVEALVARMATSGRGLYKALRCKEPPSLDRLSAMQVLFEVCPCFRFGFTAANGAILEACRDEKQVHIIDFDINQGTQYITLIQTIAKHPGQPSHIRLTGIDDPESVQRAVGGLKLIGLRLEELAKELNVPFEFRAVPARTEIVSPAMLECRPGEALIVNFAFQLHHMPDESVSTVNQRDQLLRMVRSMNPKLVTVVEQDINTNTAPFLVRFVEAYDYYSAVYNSLDATLSRDSQDRINVEKQCLARDLINIVACEGEERIERYEVAGKWRARMMMAGFTPWLISHGVNDKIRRLMKQYGDRFKVKEEAGTLHFTWEEKVLIVTSAWR